MNKEKLRLIVSSVFNVSNLSAKTRRQPIVFARHTYCYLARRYLKRSFMLIAKDVGRKTHASALHSYNQVVCLMDDPEIGVLIKRCISLVEQVEGYKEGCFYWFRDDSMLDFKPAMFISLTDGVYLWKVIDMETTEMFFRKHFETDGKITHDE